MCNQLILIRAAKVFVSTLAGDFVGIVKYADDKFLVLQQASRILTSDTERFLFNAEAPVIRFLPDDVQFPMADCRFATLFKHALPKKVDLVYPDAERLLGDLGAVLEGQDG